MKQVLDRSAAFTATSLVALAALLTLGSGPVGSVTGFASSWQTTMRALPLSGAGCFSASFPVAQWHRVACQTAPDTPYGPVGGSPSPSGVGDGTDYSAVSSGGLLNTVTGSFPSVSAGITEMGVVPGVSGTKKPDTFSLQLNSSFFSPVSACLSAQIPATCQAWQQFVFVTTSDSAFRPRVFMQYWLIAYGPSCPTKWTSVTGTGDCFTNSPAVRAVALSASQFGQISLQGSVASGGSDQAVLTTPTTAYATSNPDSMLDLASSWSAAEFDVFGDGNGTQATFGAGTTIDVMTATGDGADLAPTCSKEGFTSETNNLHLVKTPTTMVGSAPAIVSQQSNGTRSKPSCMTSPG